MGFLVHIFLAVGVLVMGTADVRLGPVWPWAAPLFLAMPYVLVFAARRASFSRRTAAVMVGVRLATFAGPLSYLAMVWTTGWVAAVREWTGAEMGWTSWPEPAAALAFAPYVVLQTLSIDAEARAMSPPGAGRRKWRAFQLRMFLSALVPPALYFGAAILIGINDVVRAHVEHVQLLGFVFIALLLAILGVHLPTLLRGTWETVPLPAGRERTLYDNVARLADFTAREVLLWRTGNLMANAAIVGLTPSRRVVLMSDSLLASLDERALAAVYGHEIAHSKLHHVPIFCSWFLFFLVGAMGIVASIDDAGPWTELGVVGGALVTWALAFGWLSRRCELEADLYAAELLNDSGGMVSALETVGGRLRDVAGWRHFSVSERVEFLVRATADPVFRRGFKRRMQFLGRTGVVLGSLAIAFYLIVLARAWPADKLHTDLALGNYSLALERSISIDEIDPDFASLIMRGSTIEDGAPLEVLEEQLRQTFDAGKFDRARDWAELLVYRGAADYEYAAMELGDAVREGREPELEWIDDTP
jgi:Zn-dependent protease with chaperone function